MHHLLSSSALSLPYYHVGNHPKREHRYAKVAISGSGSRPTSNPGPKIARAHSSYSADGSLDLAGVSETTDGPSKLKIPSLPAEGHGDRGVASCFWEWKPKFTVHYEESGVGNVDAPALLLLPGFGVGTFHYEQQLGDLGREYRVYALDFLGQGKSLPFEDPTGWSGDLEGEEDGIWGFGEETKPWAEDLVYSIDLWRDQVYNFIHEVIRGPVYVVGNSLGGFVALYFAASFPDLVKGVTLLNATPFWGFLPNPVRSPRLAKLVPWSGTFPLPAGVRRISDLIWQKISDPSKIQELLSKVYAEYSPNVDNVLTRITEIAQHPAAPASFASIMFAPQGELSFNESLIRCKKLDIPICLIYGKDDPWVRPIWGLQVKQQVPDAPYYMISPAGHCPHDEVPEVVNYLLRGWITNLESQGLVPLPLLHVADSNQRESWRDIEILKDGSASKLVKVNVSGSNFSIWKQIRSFVKSKITNLANGLR